MGIKIKEVVRLVITFTLTLVLLLSTIYIINTKNEIDIISVYMTDRHPNIDTIQRVKTNNNRIILRDTKGNGLGLIVYRGLLRDYNIQGLGEVELPYSYGKQLGNVEIKKISIESTDNTVGSVGQYKEDEWVPECATACIDAILQIEGKDTSELNIVEKDGLDRGTIVSILNSLGYNTEVVEDKIQSSLDTALKSGKKVLAGYELNGTGHAVLITNLIENKNNNKHYYEIMNPMGKTEDERYSLTGHKLNLNIDTRFYQDTSMYSIMYIIIIENDNEIAD